MEPLDVELEQPLGAVDVLEPIRAKLAHRHAVHLVLDQFACRARKKYLPAVTGRTDPRRPMHPEPDVPLLASGGLTCVQAHAHANRDVFGPLVLSQRPLSNDGRAEGSIRAGESEEERVTLRVDLAALVGPGSVADDALMLGEHGTVPRTQLLEQPCRPLDVREQEGDSPTWEFCHRDVVPPLASVVKPSSRRRM